jgi:hypothetical protein
VRDVFVDIKAGNIVLFRTDGVAKQQNERGSQRHTLMSSFASNASLIAVTTFAVTPHFPTCKSSDTFLVGS